MAKRKVYLTSQALRELASFVDQQQNMLGKREVAYIDSTELVLMDEGYYSLQSQDVKVKLAFCPDDGRDYLNPDEYVIVIEV